MVLIVFGWNAVDMFKVRKLYGGRLEENETIIFIDAQYCKNGYCNDPITWVL